MVLGKANPFTTKRVKPETEIVKEILDYLATIDGYFWRNNTTGIFNPLTNTYRKIGEKGHADILGVIRGRFIAIEVKRPGGKLSHDQIVFLDKVKSNGGFACCVTSLDELISILKSNGLMT